MSSESRPERRKGAIVIDGIVEDDVANENWQALGKSTGDSLGQLWSSICMFMLNLPTHIASLLSLVTALLSSQFRRAYAWHLESFVADLDTIKRFNLALLWSRLARLDTALRSYAVRNGAAANEVGLLTTPETLKDLVDMFQALQRSEIGDAGTALVLQRINGVLERVEREHYNELWVGLEYIRQNEIQIDGKLAAFRIQLVPYTVETMIAKLTGDFRVDGLLRRIDRASSASRLASSA
jgi:hypothetical protein